MDRDHIKFFGHSGAKAEHWCRDGNRVKVSEAYGGKSGVVVGTQGKNFVLIHHDDGSNGIYHFHEIAGVQERLRCEDPVNWKKSEVRDVLTYLGYGRVKTAMMLRQLEEHPEVKEHILTGVISTRAELENIIHATKRERRRREDSADE